MYFFGESDLFVLVQCKSCSRTLKRQRKQAARTTARDQRLRKSPHEFPFILINPPHRFGRVHVQASSICIGHGMATAKRRSWQVCSTQFRTAGSEAMTYFFVSIFSFRLKQRYHDLWDWCSRKARTNPAFATEFHHSFGKASETEDQRHAVTPSKTSTKPKKLRRSSGTRVTKANDTCTMTTNVASTGRTKISSISRTFIQPTPVVGGDRSPCSVKRVVHRTPGKHCSPWRTPKDFKIWTTEELSKKAPVSESSSALSSPCEPTLTAVNVAKIRTEAKSAGQFMLQRFRTSDSPPSTTKVGRPARLRWGKASTFDTTQRRLDLRRTVSPPANTNGTDSARKRSNRETNQRRQPVHHTNVENPARTRRSPVDKSVINQKRKRKALERVDLSKNTKRQILDKTAIQRKTLKPQPLERVKVSKPYNRSILHSCSATHFNLLLKQTVKIPQCSNCYGLHKVCIGNETVLS